MTEQKMYTRTEYEYAVRTGVRNGMWYGTACTLGVVILLFIVGLLVNV